MVLIVDADRNFAQALAIALRLDGLSAVAADSVDSALAQLKRRRFGTAVVDCCLPDAEALLGRLAAEAGIRVIASSSHGELLAAAVRRHPGLSTIQKPFRASELTARIGETASSA